MSKTGRLHKHAYRRSDEYAWAVEPPGDGDPDEAAALIADNVGELVWVARRHKLDLLVHLLAMVQLEAEERVRLRSKRKLS